MSNEVAVQKGGYLAAGNAWDAIADEAKALPGGYTGGVFLKMDGNSGVFSYGAEMTQLAVPCQAVMDPDSWSRGFLVWVDGKVVGNYMKGIHEGKALPENQIPDHGPYGEEDGPKEQHTISFKQLAEPGLQMTFQGNNSSKRRAVEALMRDFAKSFKEHMGLYPVVEINTTSFEAKDPKNPKRKFKKYAPVFKIVDWISADAANQALEGGSDEYDANDGADEIDTTPQPDTTVTKAATPTAGRRGRFA